MNEQSYTNESLISLDESSDSRKFAYNNIIHRDEFDKLKMWGDDRINNNREDR